MSEKSAALQRSPHLLAVRLPEDLYQSLARDAAMLGVSMAAVGRIRLRTGRVPSINDDQGANRL
jgi:hypothetical protein